MDIIADKPLFYKVFGLWIIILNCTLVFAAYFNVFEAPRGQLEVMTTINVAILTLILAMTLPKGIWSICFIFFMSFTVFHGGLILANSANSITDEDILYQISFWFENPETDNAIHLFNLGMIGFCLAALLFSKPVQSKKTEALNIQFNKRIFHIGGVLLCLMVAAFFAVTLSTGTLGSYGAYLLLLKNVPIMGTIFAYIYLFIGLALVLISVTYRKGFGYIYLAIFAVWALFAFKLGLRGEVMFPGTVAACMFGRRGAPIGNLTLIVALIGFLIVTGIVKNARISGDYSAADSVNPLNAVAEMGSSLRAVQEVIKWRVDGDELLLGGSYWAPFERQLAWFIPGLERKNAFEDPRLLNVVVQEKAGPIGFSPVAEAYLNFGEKGVLIMMFLFGALMAYFDNQRSRVRYDILIGVSLVPVFIMIRNSFTHVPVQVVLGLIIAYLVIYAANTRLRA